MIGSSEGVAVAVDCLPRMECLLSGPMAVLPCSCMCSAVSAHVHVYRWRPPMASVSWLGLAACAHVLIFLAKVYGYSSKYLYVRSKMD